GGNALAPPGADALIDVIPPGLRASEDEPCTCLTTTALAACRPQSRASRPLHTASASTVANSCKSATPGCPAWEWPPRSLALQRRTSRRYPARKNRNPC